MGIKWTQDGKTIEAKGKALCDGENHYMQPCPFTFEISGPCDCVKTDGKEKLFAKRKL